MSFSSNLSYLGLFLVLTWSACSKNTDLDIVILGGTVLDGSGNLPSVLDIGITADTISFIGDISKTNLNAAKEIDAKGYYVTPGFIDPHTHAMNDLSDSLKNHNLNYLLQGVTTVVTGSDGNSENLIKERLNKWSKNGIGTNAAIMVGHRNIRRSVMGVNEDAPSEEEMKNMKTLVRRGMEAGALGFSTGLYYAPASFSTTDEVIELAKVSAQYGGIYDAHIRDESTYNIGLLAAVEESIAIANQAQIPVNISHIKCLGVDVWNMSQTIVDTIEAARLRGLKITADQYPYRASGTHLSNALVPKWVFADLDDYTLKFDDPALLPKIKAAMVNNIRRRGGAGSLLLVLANMPNLAGKTLADIAEEWEMPAVDAAIKIIKNSDAAVASFNMNEDDLHLFMQQDWTMTSSDGTAAHPRKYGSFPKKIREYVLEKSVISLEKMVRNSTGLTAETFGIPKRGKLEVGYYADALIFKPEEIRDNATFTEPALYSSGMWYIFLNGQAAVEKGVTVDNLFGRVVKRL